MIRAWYQQGDVIIEPVVLLPTGAKKVDSGSHGYVLAEGEATGHAHVIDKAADIEFVQKDGMFYIQNRKLHSMAKGVWVRGWR